MHRLHRLSSAPALAPAGWKTESAQNISSIRYSTAVVPRMLFGKKNNYCDSSLLKTTTQPRPISPVQKPHIPAASTATSLCSLPRESAASSSSFSPVGRPRPEKDPKAIEREKIYLMPYRISAVLLYVLSLASTYVFTLFRAFDVSYVADKAISIMVGETPLLVIPSAVNLCVALMWSMAVLVVIFAVSLLRLAG